MIGHDLKVVVACAAVWLMVPAIGWAQAPVSSFDALSGVLRAG